MKVIKKIIIFIILVVLFAGALLTYQGYTMYKEALDKISVKDKVSELQMQENYTKFEDLPKFYKDAVVAVEDRRFYDHGALDYLGIARAVWTNIKSRELKEGGSSITQQVAKNVYFTQEKTALRKIAEVFGGGGHIFASGVRIKTFEEVDELIIELDDICSTYKDEE